MNNPVLIGLASWFFPGAGHILQKRTKRGLLIGAGIWIMFIAGVFSGGAYYPGFGFNEGALLFLLNLFAKFGNGLGMIVSFLVSVQPSPGTAALATFEYGGRLLETAGLLNFLAIIDAIDICLGRKK